MPVVVQLSDTHLTARRGPQDDALDRAVAALGRALAAPPDFVALSGDLADDGSVAALERVAAAVAPLGAPTLAVAGNHDLPGPIDEVFGRPAPVVVEGWRVVPLDTWLPGEIHGAADPDAAARLLDEDRTTPTIAFQHHPPAGPSTHPWFTLRRGPELLAVLAERPNVRALGAGHLHQAFHLDHRHLRLVGAPSTWYAIRHEGERWAKAPSAPIGALVWHLGPSGSVRAELVASGPA